jgi:hypothetical protein
LWSSIETSDIICWNELSPIISLTHCIPLGEKMEKPEDDPVKVSDGNIPYYLS